MSTAAQRARHEDWLGQITAVPTAAGREHRVIRFVEDWTRRRSDLHLRRDGAGNLLITQTRGRGGRRPLFITAHLDHPAFVVRRRFDRRQVELEFRGGVQDAYFEGAMIEVFDDADRPHRARIRTLAPKARPFKRVTAELERPADSIRRGDVGRWLFPGRLPRVTKGILSTHACDDLAAVAAAISALDLLRRRAGAGHVGLLLTRAEEIGFIGAIAACKQRSIPARARLICLENSRSFPESPIGAGPIVRVGDKISVFEPSLTNQISALLTEHQKRHPAFRWQRKLMPGGTCEATTFSAYGYQSTCLCLPLGNYHNMQDIDGVAAGRRPARVAPERIAVDDYHGLIDVLVLCARTLDGRRAGSLKDRMETLHRRHGRVLAE